MSELERVIRQQWKDKCDDMWPLTDEQLDEMSHHIAEAVREWIQQKYNGLKESWMQDESMWFRDRLISDDTEGGR